VPDEVYQLAADMGGMGFIHSAECEIMHNSVLINVHMTDAAATMGVKAYFYSSSACVYRDMKPGEPEMRESEAIPANPDNEYGWEKLYSERVAQAYGRRYAMKVRIARFQNCYGPEGTWRGGREKAPAAICRKVATAKLTGAAEIDIWGDGEQTRSFCYIDDCVDGMTRLMASSCRDPLNIGQDRLISINQLADMVCLIAGVALARRHVPGPQGVRGRNSDNSRLRQVLGWEPQISLEDGLTRTYAWIEAEVVRDLGAPTR